MYNARVLQGMAYNGVLAQLVERFNGIEEVSGSNPLCSIKKAPILGAYFMEQFRGFSHPARCRRWISSPVYRVTAGHERLLSTRGSPVGSRAPRGEDTSEPVPRLLPGASGAVRAANGGQAQLLGSSPNIVEFEFSYHDVPTFN